MANQNKESSRNINETVKVFLKFAQYRNVSFGIRRLKKYASVVLPKLNETVSSADKKYGLTGNAFSIDKFYEICKAEKIQVSRDKRIGEAKSLSGEYSASSGNENNSIWLKPNLRGERLLFVAAHELSHYLLHRSKMVKGLLRNPAELSRRGETSSELLIAELEADLFASFLLAQTERQNV